ncbi:hypothetical protein P262_00621 [Cronobacter malonaticus]|uniref:Uncharacterized protein n=1 Tax=Cronobacter malonaticus TaxID=413503 RepID=V5TW69_9ENTR|nr:hypothetical protein P262_00621 [Cronobacter malonaticus]CCJ94301.1 hypothetical protein BN131_1974 [Cronobacter malonaticus 681]
MKIYALVKSGKDFFPRFLFDDFLFQAVATGHVKRAFFFINTRPSDWRIKQQM